MSVQNVLVVLADDAGHRALPSPQGNRYHPGGHRGGTRPSWKRPRRRHGRLVLIPASVIPDDQAWFWTPEWQAKEAEADREIADGGGPVMSEDEFLAGLADRTGTSPVELT